MLIASLIIWPIVLVTAILLWAGPRARATRALELARRNAIFMLIRMPPALLAAGFAAPLMPADLIAEWVGGSSGWSGVVIASVLGGLVPSGPIVSFPLTLALSKAGVGTPQLIAFLTSWSVLTVMQTLSWDLPLLGARFVLLRVAVSLPLPVIAGGLAALMVGF
jgi:uncharacterized membrane protein YraQ (UPF0718 family)